MRSGQLIKVSKTVLGRKVKDESDKAGPRGLSNAVSAN